MFGQTRRSNVRRAAGENRSENVHKDFNLSRWYSGRDVTNFRLNSLRFNRIPPDVSGLRRRRRRRRRRRLADGYDNSIQSQIQRLNRQTTAIKKQKTIFYRFLSVRVVIVSCLVKKATVNN